MRWQTTGFASAVAVDLGWTIPQKTREFCFREARRQALRDYVPQVFPGRITYLLAEDSERHKMLLHWRALAADGLELHVGGGNHSTFFHPEHALRLAATLRACLTEVQASYQALPASSVATVRPAA
jgi:aspartate racemase